MSRTAIAATRVKKHTAPSVNGKIQLQTKANIAYFAAHPKEIDGRLRELDAEWDVERWLEVNSATLSLAGLALAITRGRKWLLLPLVVQGFFLQHAIEGYCPPLPLIRRLGVRNEAEIETERQALKAIRGDFEGAAKSGDAALRAAER